MLTQIVPVKKFGYVVHSKIVDGREVCEIRSEPIEAPNKIGDLVEVVCDCCTMSSRIMKVVEVNLIYRSNKWLWERKFEDAKESV